MLPQRQRSSRSVEISDYPTHVIAIRVGCSHVIESLRSKLSKLDPIRECRKAALVGEVGGMPDIDRSHPDEYSGRSRAWTARNDRGDRTRAARPRRGRARRRRHAKPRGSPSVWSATVYSPTPRADERLGTRRRRRRAAGAAVHARGRHRPAACGRDSRRRPRPNSARRCSRSSWQRSGYAACRGCGRFGAHMQVTFTNDGPVTFWLAVPPGRRLAAGRLAYHGDESNRNRRTVLEYGHGTGRNQHLAVTHRAGHRRDDLWHEATEVARHRSRRRVEGLSRRDGATTTEERRPRAIRKQHRSKPSPTRSSAEQKDQGRSRLTSSGSHVRRRFFRARASCS